MKFAQFVIGPAGCGKSTYCQYMQQHCDVIGRIVHVINLDPAAEHFSYQITADIRDLITLHDVMDEIELGPNGGLIFCMEYLQSHLHDWLAQELASFGDDDYVLFDCPGQIELYTHIDVFKTLIHVLTDDSWRVASVYCIDCHFITDTPKFVSGCLQALSSMVHLELPHVNLLTKMDLCPLGRGGGGRGGLPSRAGRLFVPGRHFFGGRVVGGDAQQVQWVEQGDSGGVE